MAEVFNYILDQVLYYTPTPVEVFLHAHRFLHTQSSIGFFWSKAVTTHNWKCA